MGARTGVFVLAGVLIVGMGLPLVASEPKLLTDPGQPVREAAEDGQEAAEDGLQKAQGHASEAQKDAEREASETEGNVRGGVASAHAFVMLLLGDAQRAVEDAAVWTACLAFGCGSDDPLGEGGNRPVGMSSQSSTIVPVAGNEALGLAMVVAAGAVGGAILWFTVLQRVVVFGALPLLSRIAHSEIYTNDARRLIAQIAVENPGLCLNEIVARTGYSRNAVSYHLFVLEKEEALVSIKDGKYRRYFPRGGKYVNGAKQVVSVLRNETTLKMAQHIVTNPGTIQRELCQVLGTTASAACWHAKRLEQLGVIRKERVANTVQYFPGDELGRHDYSEFGLRGTALPTPLAP